MLLIEDNEFENEILYNYGLFTKYIWCDIYWIWQ